MNSRSLRLINPQRHSQSVSPLIELNRVLAAAFRLLSSPPMASFMHASRPSSTIMRRVKEAIQAAPKGVLPEIHARRMSLIDGLTCNSRVISVPFRCSFRHALVKCNHSAARTVPYSDPPSSKDVNQLHEFIGRSHKLMVLTGAGISTESGIPDYRSPNGAYSTGFKPITHQQFERSSHFRRRYWARSYAGWKKFIQSQPNTAHYALASLERVGRINFMVTQNVDRLHHRAGSNPLELHGTVYTVICLDCGASISRELFQEQIKAANPKWAAEIEKLESGPTGSDENLGVQRPDADVEIDKKFWEEEFDIPDCQDCGGILKPDVVFFGDNVPKERADKVMKGARECDAFLVLGSSLMTMSAFRLARAAHEANTPIAIVSIGDTRADDLASLKINARCGEILPRLLDVGSLAVPSIN